MPNFCKTHRRDGRKWKFYRLSNPREPMLVLLIRRSSMLWIGDYNWCRLEIVRCQKIFRFCGSRSEPAVPDQRSSDVVRSADSCPAAAACALLLLLLPLLPVASRCKQAPADTAIQGQPWGKGKKREGRVKLERERRRRRRDGGDLWLARQEISSPLPPLPRHRPLWHHLLAAAPQRQGAWTRGLCLAREPDSIHQKPGPTWPGDFELRSQKWLDKNLPCRWPPCWSHQICAAVETAQVDLIRIFSLLSAVPSTTGKPESR